MLKHFNNYSKLVTYIFIRLCSYLCLIIFSTSYVLAQDNKVNLNISLDKPTNYVVKENSLWRKIPTNIIPKNFPTLKKIYEQSLPYEQSLRYESGSFIGKISIKQQSSQLQWAILLKTAFLDHGSIYFENRHGDIQYLGDLGSKDINNYQHKFFSFSKALSLAPNHEGNLWIFIHAQLFIYPAEVIFSPLHKAVEQDFMQSFSVLITLGGLLALFILSFIAYFKLHHEKFVFYYSLHVLLVSLHWFFASGASDIFFIDTRVNMHYFANFLLPFIWASMMQFTRHFFQYEKYSLFLNNTLKIMMYFYIFMMLLAVVMPFQVAFSLIYFLSIVFLLFAVSIGIYHVYKEQKRAIYYLIGHLVCFAAFTYQLLHYGNIISWQKSPEIWLLLAQTLNATLLAVAIAGTLKKIHLSSLQLQQNSRIDLLTQLGNRQALSETINKLSKPYAIALLKIDKLKLINETFDHDRGDLIISNTANIMKQSFNNYGQLYRYSGGEFVLLIPTNQEHMDELADQIADRIKVVESALKIELFANTSISFSLVHCFDAVNLKKLLQLAKVHLTHNRLKNTQVNTNVVASN